MCGMGCRRAPSSTSKPSAGNASYETPSGKTLIRGRGSEDFLCITANNNAPLRGRVVYAVS